MVRDVPWCVGTIRRILFCSLCNISMFDWDAVPHNGMPYVQIGFNMALCINSLLVRESLDFLPMIQYILFSINPSCLRLLWICGCGEQLRITDFMTKAQDGGKVFNLTHRTPLPPGNVPGTHFC